MEERLRVQAGDFTIFQSDQGYHIHKVGSECKRVATKGVYKKLRELYFKCVEEKQCENCKHAYGKDGKPVYCDKHSLLCVQRNYLYWRAK